MNCVCSIRRTAVRRLFISQFLLWRFRLTNAGRTLGIPQPSRCRIPDPTSQRQKILAFASIRQKGDASPPLLSDRATSEKPAGILVFAGVSPTVRVPANPSHRHVERSTCDKLRNHHNQLRHRRRRFGAFVAISPVCREDCCRGERLAWTRYRE